MAPVTPVIARKTWRTVEPIHGMIYFSPLADDCYKQVGLRGNRMGYFASRAAAFGTASAEVVIATFYNFNPELVRASIPAAWSLASPADVLAARYEAADRSLRQVLGEEVVESEAMAEAASLAHRAASAAAGDAAGLCGRALFAAHASLPWPNPHHLVLWHAQTLLREYRGDGHIAALVAAGLDPVEALATHAASGEVGAEVLRVTRAWSDSDWEAAVGRLRDRGLLDGEMSDIKFTADGQRLREQIEDQTDAAAVLAYKAIGVDGCERLRTLARPWSQAIVAAGMLTASSDRLTS